jgi:Protein of unknown function (DUF1573)
MKPPSNKGLLVLAIAGASIAFLGAVALLSVRARWVEVGKPVHDLGRVTAMTEVPVKFALRNAGPRVVHVLGANSHCGKNGCISRFLSQPGPVEPGDTYEINVIFRAPSAGPFSYKFVVYTDIADQQRIPLKIRGSVADKSPASISPEPSLAPHHTRR